MRKIILSLSLVIASALSVPAFAAGGGHPCPIKLCPRADIFCHIFTPPGCG